MSQRPADHPSHKKLRIAGWVLGVLPCLMLCFSAFMKFAKPPQAVEGLAKFGFEAGILTPLGVVELVCTVLYLVPRTAVLGAVLLTGYLGGATATHVRVSDPFWIPILLGVLLWLGLYLRDPRVRALLPMRTL
jgi:uncharacterized membrane protein YphA (DoxX/SURF4 family)